jgi:hypothetical protein
VGKLEAVLNDMAKDGYRLDQMIPLRTDVDESNTTTSCIVVFIEKDKQRPSGSLVTRVLPPPSQPPRRVVPPLPG